MGFQGPAAVQKTLQRAAEGGLGLEVVFGVENMDHFRWALGQMWFWVVSLRFFASFSEPGEGLSLKLDWIVNPTT